MANMDRDKLGKILALLASPVDGEVLAAARKVVELLGKHGLRPESLAQPAEPSGSESLWSRAGLEFMLASERAQRSVLEDQKRHLERRVAGLERWLDEALSDADASALVERYARPGSANPGLWRHFELQARAGRFESGAKIAIRKLADEEERWRLDRDRYERRRRRA